MEIARREDYPPCKDLHPIIDAAREQGWRVMLRNGGHLMFLSSDRSVKPIFGPQSPSDHRSLKNVKRQLARSGLDI